MHADDSGEIAVPAMRFTRVFHRPTGLTDGEQVWIVIAGLSASMQAMLNGEMLGDFDSHSATIDFEITSHLNNRNRLCLSTASFKSNAAGIQASVWKSVCLEMRTRI